GFDISLVSQRAAQFADGDRNGALFDLGAGPYGAKQFILLDQPSAALYKVDQQIEELWSQREFLAASRQTAFSKIELVRPELVNFGGSSLHWGRMITPNFYRFLSEFFRALRTINTPFGYLPPRQYEFRGQLSPALYDRRNRWRAHSMPSAK